MVPVDFGAHGAVEDEDALREGFLKSRWSGHALAFLFYDYTRPAAFGEKV